MDSDVEIFLSRCKYPKVKYLNIATPKTVNFPFVPNGKLLTFKWPNIKNIRLCASILILASKVS